MRKFRNKLIGFVAFSALFYFLLNGLWGYVIPQKWRQNLVYNPREGYLDKRLVEVKKYGNKDIDILFLGSSHSYRGFDPRIFKSYGLETFNLGSSAQTHLQTGYLLEKYTGYLNPKLVVYEVYPAMFSNEGVESTINIISATESLNSEMLKLIWKTKDIRAYNTLLLSLLSPTGQEVKSSEYYEDDTYIPGGFVEKKLTYNEDPEMEKDWDLLDVQIEAFKDNIAFLKSRNIPFLLVQAPHAFHNKNKEEFDHFLKAEGRYLNFNNILNLSDSLHFYNNSHLNQKGVEKFNFRFIKTLDSLGITNEQNSYRGRSEL